MAGVLPWSYSSLNAFETCPKRFYLTRISKVVQEQQTAQTLWGNRVHKALELAVKGEKALEPEFQTYDKIVQRIRAADGTKYTEQKFGLTSSFQPTAFFGKDVWFRGVVDLQILNGSTANVWDYKTGKVKNDGDQLKLFAVTTFAQHPQVERVKTAYIWLGFNKVTKDEFTRDQVSDIWQDFLPRIRRMEIAQTKDNWPPNPSGLCGWCPVGRQHCDHWKGQGGKTR